MTNSDIRNLALAAVGGALEFYEFVIFIFFTPIIAKLFFPPEFPSGFARHRPSESSQPVTWRDRSAEWYWRISEIRVDESAYLPGVSCLWLFPR